jgi:hypothetical protein
LVWQLFGGIDLQTQAQFFDNSGTRTATDERGFRQREFAGYAQDSYKIIPNLNFSYGVRYEFFGVPVEVQNRMSTLLVSPSGSGPFTFTHVGEGSGRTPLYQDDWKDIEPRGSVAWDPFRTGKTSIRAGYGLYHDRVFGQLVSLLRGDPPFQMLETQICPGFFVGAFQACTLSALSPLPTFPDSSTVNNCPPPGQPCSPILPFLVDPHLRTPYSQSWSAGIQIEPYPSLLLEANYVGSKGTHLLRLGMATRHSLNGLHNTKLFVFPQIRTTRCLILRQASAIRLHCSSRTSGWGSTTARCRPFFLMEMQSPTIALFCRPSFLRAFPILFITRFN